jgi:hypothetical protein
LIHIQVMANCTIIHASMKLTNDIHFLLKVYHRLLVLRNTTKHFSTMLAGHFKP